MGGFVPLFLVECHWPPKRSFLTEIDTWRSGCVRVRRGIRIFCSEPRRTTYRFFLFLSGSLCVTGCPSYCNRRAVLVLFYLP